MKKFILISTLMIISIMRVCGEEKYPKGLYMSFDEVINKTPSKSSDSVKIKKRSEADLSFSGGNDYKLISSNKFKKILNKEVWAFSDGDTLFINCLKFKLQKGFAKVIGDGSQYMVFDAAMLDAKAGGTAVAIEAAVLGGLVGGVFLATAMSDFRYHYALDKSTQEIHLISLNFLEKVLSKKNSEAYAKFKDDLVIMDSVYNKDQKRRLKEIVIRKYSKFLD